MAALALGYKIGGQIVDRHPHAAILYSLCAAAGIWTTLTFWLASLILPSLVQLNDIRYGVLFSSFLLFFPNLFLLGMVCPFCIRLLHRDSEQAGSTSGLVFSISTIGSLLGALVTGFMLIPNYGTQTIFAFCGFFLTGFSLLSFAFMHRHKRIAFVPVIALALMYYPATYKPTQETSVEIIEQAPSFYGQLQIVRKNGVKMMLIDGIGQNYVADDNRYITPYINFISTLPATRQTNKLSERALVIGLGAGQLPMLLQKKGLGVEVVEIDPLVAKMAEKHFAMDLADKNIHIGDGRVFLTNNTDIYDYIIIDAFNADQIAWHLISREAIGITKHRLSEEGFLAINLTSISDSRDVASIHKTLKSVYDHVNVFSYTPDHKNNLSSIVFIGSNSPVKLTASKNKFSDNQLADINRFINGKLNHLEGGVVLTDNFNPVSHQREQAQLVWRQAMRDYLGEEKLGWLLF
jgi:spermidine synthase